LSHWEDITVQLNVKSFGLACGLLWGVGLFLMTWWVIAFDGAIEGPTFIGRIYRGYEVTALGSVIGLGWAFFDGLIGGLVFAWVYNLLARSGGTSSSAAA